MRAALWLLLAAAPARSQVPGTPETPPAAEAPAATATATADDDFASFGDEFKAEKPRPDPLRLWNRAFFHVNDKFYFWLAKPFARGYGFVVPRPARLAVDRGFDNMHWPIRFLGCLLQLKVSRAGQETRRFLVNSTLGVGGLFDPADRWFGWKAPPAEDLGQAVASWGVGEGFPFTIPIMGPSNLRDGLLIVPTLLLSPVPYITDLPTGMGVAVGEQTNYISLHIGEYESLRKDALDPYTFVRDAYHKSREKKIKE